MPWIWGAVAFAALNAVIAIAFSLTVPVAYQATARVQPSWRIPGSVITTDNVDRYAAGLGRKLTAPAILDSVSKQLNIPYSRGKLASEISVGADRLYNEQIDITVIDSDPVRAAAIANAVVATYIGQPHTFADTIWFDAEATAPESPVRPQPVIDVFVAIMAAVAIVAILRLTLPSQRPLRSGAAPAGGTFELPPSLSVWLAARPVLGLAIAGVAAGIVLGATIASALRSDPLLVALAFVPWLTLAAALSPTWRLGILVVGGLLVFQSAQGLTAVKDAYTAVVSVVALATGISLWRRRSSSRIEDDRLWLAAALALGLVIALSGLVARSHGVGWIAWARDVAPYGLLILAVAVSLDVLSSRPNVLVLEMLLLVCGIASAIAYANDWLVQRGYGSLPFDLPVLQSFLLAAALFSYATAQTVAGTRKALWAIAAIVVAILLFVTGSRGALLVGGGPIAAALLLRNGPVSIVPKRLVLAVAPALAAAALTAAFLGISNLNLAAKPQGIAATVVPTPTASPAGAPSPTTQPTPTRTPTTVSTTSPPLQTRLIAGRFERILRIARDPSFQERVTVDRLAWSVFKGHPLLGIGPGYIYRWPTPGGEVKSSPYLDSGLSLLSKFGLMIVPALALLVLCLWRVMVNPRGDAIGRAALLGLGVTAFVWMTIEAPLEDKGFGLGLAVLLVLAGARRGADVPETQPETSSRDVAREPAMAGAAATG